jgi:hypothetical protein
MRNSRKNEGKPPYAAIQITVTLTVRFGSIREIVA